METVRPQNKGEHHCLRCGVEVSEAHRSEDLKHERCVTWQFEGSEAVLKW